VTTVRISPPNGLLLILDPRTGVLPDTLAGSAVASTPSSLAIGTLSEFDGETEVTLARTDDVPNDPTLSLAWEGDLETSGRLGVLTIYNEALIEVDADSTVRIQIWTNDPTEPDRIWVAFE
jgi:hypothetical protein